MALPKTLTGLNQSRDPCSYRTRMPMEIYCSSSITVPLNTPAFLPLMLTLTIGALALYWLQVSDR